MILNDLGKTCFTVWIILLAIEERSIKEIQVFTYLKGFFGHSCPPQSDLRWSHSPIICQSLVIHYPPLIYQIYHVTVYFLGDPRWPRKQQAKRWQCIQNVGHQKKAFHAGSPNKPKHNFTPLPKRICAAGSSCHSHVCTALHLKISTANERTERRRNLGTHHARSDTFFVAGDIKWGVIAVGSWPREKTSDLICDFGTSP